MSESNDGEQTMESSDSVDFRVLFEKAPGLYMILSPDFKIIAVSDAYARATMTQRESIVGRGLFEVFPDNPDDPNADGVRNLNSSLHRVLANLEPDQMAVQKYDIRRPGSEEFEERYWDPINIPVLGPNGRLRYIIHRAEDVTEMVRLKQKATAQEQVVQNLRVEGARNEEGFRLLVEGIKDYAIYMLDPMGKVVSWNRGAERIKGYRSDEIIGQHFSRFYTLTDIQAGVPEHILQTALDEGRSEGEGFRLRKNGSKFWANFVISPVRDKDNNLIGFSKITHDATERKQAEENARRLLQEAAARKAAEEHAEIILKQREQLQATMNALNQSQKMEAIGQLAGGVAHDFNNLLTVILGYCKIMMSMLKPDDPMRGFIEPINEAGERAASLTSQLLAFSRQSVLEPKILDLNEMVRKTEGLLRRLIGEDILLTAVLDPNVHRVKFDPGQLSQIIMNLAINARDAMPKGGKLTIETKNAVLGAESVHLHPDAKPGSYVMLAMTDTGCGMSADVMMRIFEPFFTTKGVGEGTGLGLSVVHGIVKQSGGFVSVYSEEKVGTCFKVYIPTVVEDVTAPREKDSTDAMHGTETVLLVEDEEGVRKLASLVLQTHGYKVLVASDGNEAIRQAEQHGGQIDLLFTDVVMPGMGGRDLANILLTRYAQMKVLFSSGYTNDAVVRHGLSQDDVSFLQKPYDPFALVAKVRQVLDEK